MSDVSRRTILGGAVGALAVGALFGPARAIAVPGTREWAGLDASIDGDVVVPANGAEYLAAKQVFNSNYDGSTPAAVVTIKSQSDIQKAVAFAGANGVVIAPRGGGHSYTGASSTTAAMVLDLRQLASAVDYDDATGHVTVTPATSLFAVHDALAAVGRAIPTGTCPTVGTVGLALGGGLGGDSRRAGLTCDAMVSASVVLPTGDVVTASASDHPDLFWGLRGGGGGNFGVTTSMTFTTFPTGDTDVVHLYFPASAAARAIVGWQQWISAADRSAWGLVDISADAGGLRCGVLATCAAGSGAAVAEAITSAVGVQPIRRENRTLDHMGLVMYLAGGSATSEPRGFVAGSDVVSTLTSDAADAIVDAVLAWPGTVGGASVIVDAIDGAVGDVDPAGSAFPWRRQSAVLQWYVDTPSLRVRSIASKWVRLAHQLVRSHSVGGYVNYLEPDTRPVRYFAGNLPRLVAIRQTYDPTRMMVSGLDF